MWLINLRTNIVLCSVAALELPQLATNRRVLAFGSSEWAN